MSDAKVRGVVHLVEETKTYGEKGFRKRMVVLEQDKGSFTNYVPVEFTRDACDTVDGLKKGDEVEIVYRLNGRRWQKDANSEVRFFVNLEALTYQVVGEGSASTGSANDAFDTAGGEDDDAPF